MAWPDGMEKERGQETRSRIPSMRPARTFPPDSVLQEIFRPVGKEHRTAAGKHGTGCSRKMGMAVFILLPDAKMEEMDEEGKDQQITVRREQGHDDVEDIVSRIPVYEEQQSGVDGLKGHRERSGGFSFVLRGRLLFRTDMDVRIGYLDQPFLKQGGDLGQHCVYCVLGIDDLDLDRQGRGELQDLCGMQFSVAAVSRNTPEDARAGHFSFQENIQQQLVDRPAVQLVGFIYIYSTVFLPGPLSVMRNLFLPILQAFRHDLAYFQRDEAHDHAQTDVQQAISHSPSFSSVPVSYSKVEKVV